MQLPDMGLRERRQHEPVAPSALSEDVDELEMMGDDDGTPPDGETAAKSLLEALPAVGVPLLLFGCGALPRAMGFPTLLIGFCMLFVAAPPMRSRYFMFWTWGMVLACVACIGGHAAVDHDRGGAPGPTVAWLRALFAAATACACVLLARACRSQPGYLEQAEDPQEAVRAHSASRRNGEPALSSAASPSSAFCMRCGIPRPMRAAHCAECGRCVRRFDRHCPWLDTCVGQRNQVIVHAAFAALLLAQLLFLLCAWCWLRRPTPTPTPARAPSLPRVSGPEAALSGATVSTCVVLLLHLAWQVPLFVAASGAILHNLTLHEHKHWSGYGYLTRLRSRKRYDRLVREWRARVEPEFHNPFHGGWRANVLAWWRQEAE